SSRRRHTSFSRDWSSDVCSSDLSPYLTVVDGQSARLVIGDQIPFASTTQTSNNSGNVTVTQNVEILDTGVVLEITPRIHANNSEIGRASCTERWERRAPAHMARS